MERPGVKAHGPVRRGGRLFVGSAGGGIRRNRLVRYRRKGLAMSMTQEEAVELDTFLTRIEKHHRGWWLTRWLWLAMGLFQIAVGAVVFKSGLEAAPALPDKPGATVSAFDMYSANLSATTSCIAFVGAIFLASVGGFVVVFSLAHWRRDRRDRLLVKFARSCLAALVPVPYSLVPCP